MTPSDQEEIRKIIRSELYRFGRDVLFTAALFVAGIVIYQLFKHFIL